MGPYGEDYAAIAGRTAAAVGTNVHALSKVGFLEERVVGLSTTEVAIMMDPVPVPLITSIIVTDMKRVPDVDAGMKFSLVVPLCGHSTNIFNFVASFPLSRAKVRVVQR